MVQVSSQKSIRMFNFFPFNTLKSQLWLNQIMDDGYPNHIIEFEKGTHWVDMKQVKAKFPI
jgi:hypothetical protein